MTSTGSKPLTKRGTMVEVELAEDGTFALLSTDKSRTNYSIVKDRSGHIFFQFKIDKGTLPDELKGKYSSIQKGVEAFQSYERRMNQTQASKNEELDKARKSRRAELQPKVS